MPLDILIGGSPSSGTTLLSLMLDSHPTIVCGPELGLFAHPGFWRGDLSDRCPGIRLLYDHLAWYGVTRSEAVRRLNNPHTFIPWLYAQRGKRLRAEKSPPNVYAMPAYLEVVPTGRCLVVMRDGRDVVCSLMLRGSSFEQAVERWTWSARYSLRALEDPRAMLIQYADLVTSPERELSEVLAFVGAEGGLDAMLERTSARPADDPTISLPTWSQRTTDPISASGIGGWRGVLSDEQARAFKAGECAEMMRAFGY